MRLNISRLSGPARRDRMRAYGFKFRGGVTNESGNGPDIILGPEEEDPPTEEPPEEPEEDPQPPTTESGQNP